MGKNTLYNRLICIKLIACLSVVLLTKSILAQYEGYTGILEQDSLALIAFYNATDGPDWLSNQDGFSTDDLSEDVLDEYQNNPYLGMGKWLEGPVKDWFGVMVEEIDGVWRVVRLWPVVGRREGGQNNLSGYIPGEVGYLTALKWFRVNGNDGLAGTELPDEVYHPTLERFDVEKCNMAGIISNEFRKCTKINYINLRYNDFEEIPVMDFLAPEHLLDNFTETGTNNSIMFLYSTRLSFAQIEPSIDYFYTISDIPAKIRIEARDCNNVGIEKEFIVSPGGSVTLENYDMGTRGTGTWLRNGINTYLTGNEFTIENIADQDTGYYQLKIENDYVKSYDQNTNYAAVYTKKMYVRYNPSAPVCTGAKSSYSGNEVLLTFSKPMAETVSGQATSFSVSGNGKTINIKEIALTGRLNNKLKLSLDQSLVYNDTITITYHAGDVVCASGGALASFSDYSVENYTRQTVPHPVSAITRTDGAGIYITFDEYVDQHSFTPSDFTLNNANPNNIVDIVLEPGEFEDQFSETILLVLENTLIDSNEVLSLNYTLGTFSALYGAALQPFDSFAVENTVDVQTTPVTILFEDGGKDSENVVIHGNIKLLPITLYDDGTNGDQISSDNIWTRTLDVTNGDYNWSVYKRDIEVTYDTLTTVDPETGKITIELTPNEEYTDKLLSEGYELSFTVNNGVVTGDTTFSIKTNSIVFILDMKKYAEANPSVSINPYLMGINDDWTEGLQLSPILSPDTSEYDYIVTVGGFSIGDSINFNFRNYEVWENNSPEKRKHVVKSKTDTIKGVFGVYGDPLSINTTKDINVQLHPNPVKDILYIITEDIQHFTRLEIIDIQGQIKLVKCGSDKVIDLSMLERGLYLLKVTHNNKVYFNKILKY